MKFLGIVSFTSGIFLIILGVLLIIGGQSRFYTIVSRQDPIDTESLSGGYDFSNKEAIFNNQIVSIPRYIAQSPVSPEVLGETSVNKRIEVDLTNQRLYAFEGENKVLEFLISSGKWNKTPKGVFRIWTKLRFALMKGGSKALGTYYYLPNVPYTMYFYNELYPKTDGYGIHAAYWHNNFGHPMSHGCINMKEEDVEKLYYWANPQLRGQNGIKATQDNPGTEVIIYGDAPTD